MTPKFRAEVDRYKAMTPEAIEGLAAECERMGRALDSMLSALRRAQKEVRRDKVVVACQ